MKILHIINSLATGGAEKLLLETLPLYNKKGITVDVLVLNGTAYPFMKELEALNCCKIYSLGVKSVYNPIHIFKIMPYLKIYNIVHVHLFPAQYWVVLAKILSFSSVTLFFTEHNTTNRRLGSFWFRIIDKNIYKFYTKIISISAEIKEILMKNYSIENSKIELIENGVNLQTIKNAVALKRETIDSKLSLEHKIIIQVAGFREQKDQETLIKAMSLLPEHYKLLLVGEGVLKSTCEDLVSFLDLDTRVIFLGVRMDVPQLLKTADIIVLSSKYEGLSLSSIEGMASGKPFVASDVPGLREVVKDAGILFEQGNAKELAFKILKLLEDKSYYDFVVTACQKRAQEYDITVMVDKHITLYESYAKK